MKGKYLLAAACAISLATGYIVGKKNTSPAEASQATSESPVRPDRPSATKSRTRSTDDSALLASILNGRNISNIPAAELAALITRLSKYEPGIDPLLRAKQFYQLQLLIAKLSPADFVTIADSISSDPEAKKSGVISSILSALARKDPDRALDWAAAQKDHARLYSTVIGAIAQDDPDRAADLLRKSFLDGSFSNNQLWTASYGVANAMAKLGVTPLLSFIDTLPQRQQSNIINNITQSVPEGQRLQLLDELFMRKNGDARRELGLNGVFTDILASDPAAASEWFTKLPDNKDKNNLRINTITSLFHRGEQESAVEWVREAITASPGKEKETLQEVIGNIVYNNPEDIPLIANLLPEGVEFTAKELENNAINSLHGSTAGITQIAALIRNPAEKARLIANTLDKISTSQNQAQSSQLNSADYEILAVRIASMNFSGEDAALVNAALQFARTPSDTNDK